MPRMVTVSCPPGASPPSLTGRWTKRPAGAGLLGHRLCHKVCLGGGPGETNGDRVYGQKRAWRSEASTPPGGTWRSLTSERPRKVVLAVTCHGSSTSAYFVDELGLQTLSLALGDKVNPSPTSYEVGKNGVIVGNTCIYQKDMKCLLRACIPSRKYFRSQPCSCAARLSPPPGWVLSQHDDVLIRRQPCEDRDGGPCEKLEKCLSKERSGQDWRPLPVMTSATASEGISTREYISVVKPSQHVVTCYCRPSQRYLAFHTIKKVSRERTEEFFKNL
ncbi:uncharacterized protein LOC107137518 [Marmota marmota marmota]|uniref:uncharacterized protein LOC107137518 n=1 Tax=Marmota marmota marmota TaxID=9994 RepID=UPI000762A818|nr:uncharacterized protein LOC107137518 [Marmota marmota marmota]XP_015335491.1 uncharacterized protein LOC107137518 [Marmota marmota marmota]XP_048660834.1 uncharacterized protein LOC107137518 [Marmota marmota marmota]XP_048660835.1 uncharacterized protein LOC107137518 [Marmota marmota marmota]XP_048660836.1 uncharacterized protein LOC107137518 [Marmota marmota marmota]